MNKTTAPSVPGQNRWQEREDAIVRSIMSGNNACGTIQQAMASGKFEDFLRQMIRPTLQICAGEAHQLQADRNAASRQAEAWRQTLEYVAANATASSPAHIQAYADRALGRGQ